MTKIITTFNAPETGHNVEVALEVEGNTVNYVITPSDSLKELTEENTDESARLLYFLTEMFLNAFKGPEEEETNNNDVILN